MRRMIVGVVGLATIGALVGTTTSDAATTRIDLSMTGSVVAGVTSAETFHELPFTFTMKNNSTTKAADSVVFTFSITNGTAATEDYVCPLISNHFAINPDTPACEPGTLGAGKSARAAILVQPTKSQTTLKVRACASSNATINDPVSSNNCKTLSVKIV
jgi:hypothetical protein